MHSSAILVLAAVGVVAEYPKLQVNRLGRSLDRVLSRSSKVPSTAGFMSPSVQMSRGGGAICVTGLIPVTVTANNTLFSYPVPLDQIQVTETFLDLITAGSSFAQQIRAGSHQVTGTFNISATLCTPCNNVTPDGVQIATHGVGFDKSYWDFASGHSYADVAAAHGYATFFYDRLGVGASTKPADGINVVQSKLELAILRFLVSELRAGKISNVQPSKVVGVGHSFGSLLTQGVTASFPDDFDAVILTGLSLLQTAIPAFYTGLNLKIASQQNATRFGSLDNTYLVSSSDISDQLGFLRAPGFDPKILPIIEATKGLITFGELFSLTDVTAPATNYTKPVAIVNGANDFPFCFGNCTYPSNLVEQVFPVLYPAVPQIRTGTYLASIAGHGLNVHYSAVAAFDWIQNFIHTQV